MFYRIRLSRSPILFTTAKVEGIHSTLITFHLPALLELTHGFHLVVSLTCGFAQPGAKVAFMSKDVTPGDSILL